MSSICNPNIALSTIKIPSENFESFIEGLSDPGNPKMIIQSPLKSSKSTIKDANLLGLHALEQDRNCIYTPRQHPNPYRSKIEL